ncbi:MULTISPECIES: toll/interleukin-1 receptor domain-containing protein [Mesorhizobium]|uniref:toll/interleukin-1 receptor domain-containing protein n=1 Tax=Mesorhizobium TaxID=68287 RepID=UPI0013151D7A|nr:MULTISPECIES: toll/interleukin-1 receptor domain-containing protein [Mesorhizobium]
MDYHIFVSYAHKNGEIAASLASQLADLGLKVFLAERNLSASEHWEPAIRSALKNSKVILCLITPESKSSGWVHAEAGAAWVLEKPILPALRFVEPSDLIEILRLPLGRKIETPEQIDALLDDVSRIFSVSRVARPNATAKCGENFNALSDWNNALKIGPWTRSDESQLIAGRGMHNYLLSQNHYSPNCNVQAILRFAELSPANRLDAVNAGIVFGWTTPLGVRRYFNLLMNQERLFVELIGDRGGDAYLDYQHLDSGIPFCLTEGATYDIAISIGDRQMAAIIKSSKNQWTYTATLPETPIGRIGLRPWRSRVECEKFEIMKG